MQQTARDVARCWAGFASLGAGLIHLAVVREHLAESTLFGVFFLVAGTLQVGWALLGLAVDDMPLPGLAAAGQLGLIVLWAVDRTVGIPVGPDPWTPEPLGTADVLCVVLEAVAVVAGVCWLALSRESPQRPMRAGRYVLLVGAGALLVAGVTTPALAATDPGGAARGHGHALR